MPRLLLIIFLCLPFLGLAQVDTTQIPIPLKNRIVLYESTFNFGHDIAKADVYRKIEKWFVDTSVDLKKKLLSSDKAKGEILGLAIFKIVTNENGNHFWIRTALKISVADSGYSFQSYNYFEKPMVKGVTNDYSKIEYRWRDYRNGKPWTPDDKNLFLGLNQHAILLAKTFDDALQN